MKTDERNDLKQPSDIQILIVEDDELSSQILNDYLSDLGFKVQISNDGQMGFIKAKDLKPDLILLDIMMPRLDGYQFLAKMLEINLNIPVIMTTALGDVNSVKKALKSGAKDYLVKPFELNDIKTKIQKILNLSYKEEDKPPLDFNQSIEITGNIFTLRIEGSINKSACIIFNNLLIKQANEMFSGKIKVLIDLRDLKKECITEENISYMFNFYGEINGLDSFDKVKIIIVDNEAKYNLQSHPVSKYFEIISSKPEGLEKLKRA